MPEPDGCGADIWASWCGRLSLAKPHAEPHLGVERRSRSALTSPRSFGKKGYNSSSVPKGFVRLMLSSTRAMLDSRNGELKVRFQLCARHRGRLAGSHLVQWLPAHPRSGWALVRAIPTPRERLRRNHGWRETSVCLELRKPLH